MAQPDISQILAALAQQGQAGTPQTSAPPQQQAFAQPPAPYGIQSPPLGGYLPQPSNSGSVDLSAIKPSNSGSVSIADAIAKAKSIAADQGVSSYDPRLNARPSNFRSRSRSRSPARRDNYSSNPYRDERRDDPRRGGNIGYGRSPSPDRRGSGGGGYRSNDSDSETIRVKSSLVGLIIGRNGENLRKVESESGARVQFIQPKEPNQQERQCTISGPVRAREDAKQAIFTIIEDNGGSNIMNDKGSYTAGMAGRAKVNLPALRDGEHTFQMLVPDKTVGLIIGRGGETIKDIQEKSGCHVNIVGENKSINGQRPVNLIGTERSTQIARDLILEVVDSDGRGGTLSGSGTNNVSASRDRGYENFAPPSSDRGGGGDDAYEEKTIKVPSEAVGMIIGKGGETIKELQRSTGCKINVNQPKPPDVTRNIDLAGTRRSMQAAERVIWEKVETVRERDSAGGGPRGGRGGGSSTYDSAPQSYGYAQPQQSAAPVMPAYGGFPGAQPQQTQYQMPFFGQQQQAAAPAQGADGQQAAQLNPALYAQYFAQYMAQRANQGQQGGGGQ